MDRVTSGEVVMVSTLRSSPEHEVLLELPIDLRIPLTARGLPPPCEPNIGRKTLRIGPTQLTCKRWRKEYARGVSPAATILWMDEATGIPVMEEEEFCYPTRPLLLMNHVVNLPPMRWRARSLNPVRFEREHILRVAGRDLSCTFLEVRTELSTLIRTWYSPEILGFLVRRDWANLTPDGEPRSFQTNFEVLEFDTR
ncbi:MAG: hypothetical protein HYZ53_25005 [Planctomycetes bacterium]|nr:hypothetical protein [Planctomycetota bacterium]